MAEAVAEAIAGSERLVVEAGTGTGKTFVAFQVAWKLWSSRWNRAGAYRRPKILYLADGAPTPDLGETVEVGAPDPEVDSSVLLQSDGLLQ